MALKQILSKDCFNKPSSLMLTVLAERSQAKVTGWTFNDGSCQPVEQKANKVVAVTDSGSVTKVTLLEAMSNSMEVGKTYKVLHFGTRVYGSQIVLTFTPRTKIFRSAKVQVAPQLEMEGQALLFPPSPERAISDREVACLFTLLQPQSDF